MEAYKGLNLSGKTIAEGFLMFFHLRLSYRFAKLLSHMTAKSLIFGPASKQKKIRVVWVEGYNYS